MASRCGRLATGQEPVPEGGQPVVEAAQLFDVSRRQGLQLPAAQGRETEPDDAVVAGVLGPGHQARLLGAVDELDDAVVSEQEMAGDVADRGGRTVPTDGEEELVLGGREAGPARCLLAPAEEPAQPVPEREQRPVVRVLEPASAAHIGERYFRTGRGGQASENGG